MIVAVHQPNYIPWGGYFYKIYKSDIFVILDDVQYVKRGYINRNKIKTHNGNIWLTVPVRFAGTSRCGINEVFINNESNWKENHLQNIEINYKKCRFFNEYFPEFKSIILKDWVKLADLNIALIKSICQMLGIRTEIMLSSQMKVEGSSTERIVNICKELGADAYLSGKGGAKYQDENLYRQNGIELVYSDYREKPYKQMWGDFSKGISIIDYMLNCGMNIKEFWNENVITVK